MRITASSSPSRHSRSRPNANTRASHTFISSMTTRMVSTSRDLVGLKALHAAEVVGEVKVR